MRPALAPETPGWRLAAGKAPQGLAATMNNHIATPIYMPAKHLNGLSAALLGAACALLAGCSSSPLSTPTSLNPLTWLTPYRADVIQGNFISSEQVAQLRPGLSRTEVRNLLGTPLLASVFHADRWDYVFTIKRSAAEPRIYKYTVTFKGEALERFEGDAMPSEAEFIAQLDNRRQLGKVPTLEATPEQLNATQVKAPAAAAPAAPAATAPASNSYPPLESRP